MKKISIIVPVYKVEFYLEKCVNSIINQTYKNLEIILVDDGSPDNCGAMCEELAKVDNRIKVIHKENGGLSSARNAGIDIATGEYVAFIDSDDWIEPDFIEVLEKLLTENDADFSVCGMHNEYTEESTLVRNHKISTSVVELSDIFVQIIDNPLFYGYAWNKLFKKDIIAKIRFDETLLFCEDIDYSVRVADKCQKVAFTSEKLHHYRHHSLSMTGEIKYNPRKLYILRAFKNMMPYYAKNCPSKVSTLNKNYLKVAISLKGNMILNKVSDNEVINELNSIITEYYPKVLKDKSIKLSTKINIFISNKFPGIILYIKQRLLKLRRG